MLQREHGSGGAILDGNAHLLAIQCEGDTFGTTTAASTVTSQRRALRSVIIGVT
ncbi:MAG: hypothetical protein ACLR5F_13335 [Faecalibacterium sp.]